jgi:hypothetical protein
MALTVEPRDGAIDGIDIAGGDDDRGAPTRELAAHLEPDSGRAAGHEDAAEVSARLRS